MSKHYLVMDGRAHVDPDEASVIEDLEWLTHEDAVDYFREEYEGQDAVLVQYDAVVEQGDGLVEYVSLTNPEVVYVDQGDECD